LYPRSWWLIHNEDFWIGEDSTRKADELFLAYRELSSTFPHLFIIAVLEANDKIMRPNNFSGVFNFFSSGNEAAVLDIFANCAEKRCGVMGTIPIRDCKACIENSR
jgi:hypothetical protein